MAQAPILLLQASIEDRAARLYQDYVEQSLLHYRKGTDDPYAALHESVLESLQRIKKRLGGLKFQQMVELLASAISSLRDQGDSAGFYALIEMLLNDYYDASYAHYQNKSAPRVVVQGNWSEVNNWLDCNPQRIQTVSLQTPEQAAL